MLPLGGLFIAIFAGWIMSQNTSNEEFDIRYNFVYQIWRVLIRFVAPAAIMIVFLNATGLI